MATIAPRSLLVDFVLANPLYSGAQLHVYVADVATGTATTTLATLYRAPVGTEQEANPFRLDGDGKMQRPVYVDGPVVVRVHASAVPVHDTGVIGLMQRFREEWETGLVYQVGDLIRDGAAGSDTGYLYICAEAHEAGASFDDDLAAGKWVLFLTGGTGGTGGSGVDVVGTTSGSFGTSSANYIKITGNTSGNPPLVAALGSDAHIDVRIGPKGVEGQLITNRLLVRDITLEPATGTGSTAAGAMPYVTQDLVTSIIGTYTSGVAGPFSWIVSNDTADASGVLGGNVYYMFAGNSFGGTGMRGGRVGLNVSHSLNRGNTSNSSAETWFHTGIQGQTVAAFRDGGTPNDFSGHLFGGFLSSELRPGAKYWNEVKILEGNVSADALSSVNFKLGLTVATSTTDAEEANVEEAFLSIGAKKANATASKGLRTGLLYGGAGGYWGIPAHGALIEATPTTVTGGSPPAMTAAYGMDLALVTFNGAFLRSADFAVDGAGNAGSDATTAGVVLQTRSAVNAATATVTGVTVLDGGTFTGIPTFTISAPPGSGTTATGAVATVGLRIVREIVTAGSGYSLNDVLNVVGGTSTGTAQLRVTEVTPTGGITQAVLQTVGSYSVVPTTPIAVTGGGGTGATFGLGWQILTCTVTGAGSNYPQFPAPIITVGSTGLVRRAKLAATMSATQVPLVLNSGGLTQASTLTVGVASTSGGATFYGPFGANSAGTNYALRTVQSIDADGSDDIASAVFATAITGTSTVGGSPFRFVGTDNSTAVGSFVYTQYTYGGTGWGGNVNADWVNAFSTDDAINANAAYYTTVAHAAWWKANHWMGGIPGAENRELWGSNPLAIAGKKGTIGARRMKGVQAIEADWGSAWDMHFASGGRFILTGDLDGAAFTGSVSGTTLTVTAVSAGSIEVGHAVAGGTISDNTRIVALGTGTGGTGTYTVSISQTTPSESLVSGAPMEGRGLWMDTGINICRSNKGNRGVMTAIGLGDWSALWPIRAGVGTIMETVLSQSGTQGKPAFAAAIGFNLPDVTFDQAAIWTPGFFVGGTGNIGGRTVGGSTLQTTSQILAKTAVVGSVTVVRGGLFGIIPTLTFSASPGGGTTATATVSAMAADVPRSMTGSGGAQGSGYVVGDVLTDDAASGTAATRFSYTVTAVDSAGRIIDMAATTPGSYSVLPTNPVTLTGGTGTGATVTPYWTILTVTVTGAGTLYAEQAPPTIAVSGVGGQRFHNPILIPVMTATQTALSLNPGGRVVIPTTHTPSSASDTGTAGTIAWDSSYIYVATAANTWKRAAIATW